MKTLIMNFLLNPVKVLYSLTAVVIVIGVLLLAGCGGNQIIRSDVPVITSCVTSLPVRPAYRTPTLAPDATEAQKVVAVALDWLDSRPYEAALEAGLAACQ